jgi:hypothetical protein
LPVLHPTINDRAKTTDTHSQHVPETHSVATRVAACTLPALFTHMNLLQQSTPNAAVAAAAATSTRPADAAAAPIPKP